MRLAKRKVEQFGTWTAPQCPFVIEYDLQTFDEIAREVGAGIQALSRGGLEVGGLLFGSFNGKRLRILASERLPCEHAFGPAFRLSDNDKRTLAERLASHRADPIRGYSVVGWYHSHLRGLAFSGEDLAVHDQFFPEPWQVLLLERPDESGALQPDFYFRQEGSLATAPPHAELRAALNGPTPVNGGGPIIDGSFAAVEPAASAVTEFEPPAFGVRPRRRRSQTKVVAVVLTGVVVLCVAAMAFLRFYFQTGSADTGRILRVEAARRNGIIEVSWDKASVADAQTARLEIHDGGVRGILTLDRNALSLGKLPYRPNSDVASFRLLVDRRDGTVLEGATTVVAGGAPSPAPAPAPGVTGAPKPVTLENPPPAVVATTTAPAVAEPPKPAVVENPPPVAATTTVARTNAPPVPDVKVKQPIEKAPAPVAPKKFTPPPAERAATVKPADPKLDPPAAPELVQTSQIARQAIPDRPIAVPAPPPPQPQPQQQERQLQQQSPAPAPQKSQLAPPQKPPFRLEGRWTLQPGGYSRSPAVPEAVAITITNSNGAISGTLEARYRSRSKTDHIRFSFSGNGGTRFPWTAPDGRQGNIEFIRVPNSPDTVEVVWRAPDSNQVFDEVLKRIN